MNRSTLIELDVVKKRPIGPHSVTAIDEIKRYAHDNEGSFFCQVLAGLAIKEKDATYSDAYTLVYWTHDDEGSYTYTTFDSLQEMEAVFMVCLKATKPTQQLMEETMFYAKGRVDDIIVTKGKPPFLI